MVLALILWLLQNPAATPVWWGWPTVAEAWTAANERATIDAGYRLFSAPDMAEMCARAPSPARLVEKDRVTLYVGEWFGFSSLRIVAVDAAGRPLPPVPVMLEVEEVDPPLFRLSNDMIGYGGVTPARTGRFRFHARTICPETSADVVFPAVVRKR